MVLIICTKNTSNLTNRYWDMVPDRQKVWTDGRTEWTDERTDNAKTISLRLRWGIIKTVFSEENYVSPTINWENSAHQMTQYFLLSTQFSITFVILW